MDMPPGLQHGVDDGSGVTFDATEKGAVAPTPPARAGDGRKPGLTHESARCMPAAVAAALAPAASCARTEPVPEPHTGCLDKIVENRSDGSRRDQSTTDDQNRLRCRRVGRARGNTPHPEQHVGVCQIHAVGDHSQQVGRLGRQNPADRESTAQRRCDDATEPPCLAGVKPQVTGRAVRQRHRRIDGDGPRRNNAFG